MADDFPYDAQRAAAARRDELLSLEDVLALLACDAVQLQADIDKGWAPKPVKYAVNGLKPNGKKNWVRSWRRGDVETCRAAQAGGRP